MTKDTKLFLLANLILPAVAVCLYCIFPKDQPSQQMDDGFQRFSGLPVHFIANHGQLDPRVSYYIQGASTTVSFTTAGVYYTLRNPSAFANAALSSLGAWTVQLEFIDANPSVWIQATDRNQATVNYFRGTSDQWVTEVPTYASVCYRDLWPGIDLVFSGPKGNLKYTFYVHPGADPRKIRLAYRGAESVELTSKGSLHIDTPAGGFSDERPVAWQESGGVRRDVAARFLLQGGEVGFSVGQYDRQQVLVIDPVVLVYAGYVGGPGSDRGYGVAVDTGGNAYLSGYTASSLSSFPVTVGPDLTHNGSFDAFVVKVNPSGTALVYAGYIGGSGDDRGYAVAVDTAGNAYVAGSTTSSEATFPVTAGPDMNFNGDTDAFVAKVNASGTALVYAGYIGGSGFDSIQSIAVDTHGDLYAFGSTSSSESTFPVVGGPDVSYNGGPLDAFVAKVNAGGDSLVFSGYLGGAGNDSGRGIALDSSGNLYVTGYTSSSEATFPVSVGPDTTYNGGDVDAFIAKLGPAGTGLVYCGYIGGAGADYSWAVAVDAGGSAYITGRTGSTETTFPATNGPDTSYNGGGWDAFVAKVNPSGGSLAYAGYIGGSSTEMGLGIGVDAAGNAYVAGEVSSTEASFPVIVGPDTSYNGGGRDGFVAKVNATGSALVYSGYIGGSADDGFSSIAVDAAGNAYLNGEIMSSESTFPVVAGPDTTWNGLNDAVAIKIAAFPGTAGPTLAFRNGFNAIETSTFPSPSLRNSGGNFRLNPAVAMSAGGRVFLAARDSAVGLWINFLKPDNTYNGWVSAGGNALGNPDVAVSGETAWIAFRDPWNSYWVRSFDPNSGLAASIWLQGILDSDPKIAGCPNGDLYITGRDNYDGIWTRRYSGSLAAWQAWTFIGGITSGTPGIACGSDNAAYIAVRDTSKNMWLARVFGESTNSWHYGEGIFDGDIQVAANGALVHVIGLSLSVPWYRTWQVGVGWQGWTTSGGVLAHVTPAVYGGHVYLAGQDLSGKVFWWSSLSSSWTNFGLKNVAGSSRFSAGAR